MGCIVEFCCWVCVCVFVLVGNQFVFVFLCLVDKKGQENARKSGHVFLCLNLNLCSLEFLLKMDWILIFFFVLILFSYLISCSCLIWCGSII